MNRYFTVSMLAAFAACVPSARADERPILANHGYRIGIRDVNTDVGVRVVRVFPDSAAARAGLQVDDVILTVNGVQVGLVLGRVRDVLDESVRHADAQGRVRLLVLSGRTGKLANVNLQLSRSATVIRGVIRTVGDRPIPASARVTVRLIQIPNWNAQPSVVVEETVAYAGRTPINYRIEYKRDVLRPNRRYALEVEIAAQGKPLYRTRAPHWMGEGRWSEEVELVCHWVGAKPETVTDRVIDFYRIYLGRAPDGPGLENWVGQVGRGMKLHEVEAHLLSSPEFYDRCENDPRTFVLALYQILQSRAPTGAEVNVWLRRIEVHKGNRFEVASEFLAAARK